MLILEINRHSSRCALAVNKVSNNGSCETDFYNLFPGVFSRDGSGASKKASCYQYGGGADSQDNVCQLGQILVNVRVTLSFFGMNHRHSKIVAALIIIVVMGRTIFTDQGMVNGLKMLGKCMSINGVLS